jgi:U3 small nucleolar RNA-associated protein 10
MIVKWSTLAIETILQMRQLRTGEEIIVSRIMPFIAKGLQMKDTPEFQISTYTALSVLASNHSLTDQVVHASMDSICRGWTEKSRRCGILCLVTLAQKREDDVFPESVLKSLLSIDDLLPLIESLPAKIPSGQFVLVLAKNLLGSSQLAKHRSILTEIAFSENISNSERQNVVQTAINQYYKAGKKHQTEVGRWISSVSQEYKQEFKDSVMPLINTLPTEQLSEIETLTKLSLKVSLFLVSIDNQDSIDEDKMLIDTPNEINSNTIEMDPFSSLPEELSHPSFFSLAPEHTAVIDLFVKAIKKGNVDTFLASPLLSMDPVSMPSLLARTWSTVSYPANIRATALNMFTQYSSELESSDFQGFIPYLIVALTDSSKEIRDAAVDSLFALKQLYSSSSKKIEVVGLMNLYPTESDELKWLMSAEANWLVTSLTEVQAECRLDSNYVVRLLTERLNDAGKKGKKDKYPPFVIKLTLVMRPR